MHSRYKIGWALLFLGFIALFMPLLAIAMPWRLQNITPLPAAIQESSALLYAHNSLWTINDSGNKAVIYKLNPVSGKLQRRIAVIGAPNNDWEAMAQDNKYLYIGDIGNNSGARKYFYVLRLTWQSLLSAARRVPVAGVIKFTLPNYRPGKYYVHAHAFDMEAMLSQHNKLLVFSKDWQKQQTKVYLLAKKPGNYTAKLAATLATHGMVTAACYYRGNVLLLAYSWRALYLQPVLMRASLPHANWPASKLQRVWYFKKLHGQTEGLACVDDGRLWVSRESRGASADIYHYIAA